MNTSPGADASGPARVLGPAWRPTPWPRSTANTTSCSRANFRKSRSACRIAAGRCGDGRPRSTVKLTKRGTYSRETSAVENDVRDEVRVVGGDQAAVFANAHAGGFAGNQPDTAHRIAAAEIRQRRKGLN